MGGLGRATPLEMVFAGVGRGERATFLVRADPEVGGEATPPAVPAGNERDRLPFRLCRSEAVKVLLSSRIHLPVTSLRVERNDLRHFLHDFRSALVMNADLALVQAIRQPCTELRENAPPLPCLTMRRGGGMETQHAAVGARRGAFLPPG